MSADEARDCLAAYDQWAATYDSIDNPLVAMAASTLERRASWFASARVLELGCGTGRNAHACLAWGARSYTGVDGSPGMLAEARRRVSGPVTWIEGELTGSFEGSFDVVLISLVLEHVRDVEPVIAAAARALAPAGRLVILELHPELHARGVGANFRTADGEIRLPSFRHDATELRAACARASLEVVEEIQHVPDDAALARSQKLRRYEGREVLLEVVSARRGSPRGR